MLHCLETVLSECAPVKIALVVPSDGGDNLTVASRYGEATLTRSTYEVLGGREWRSAVGILARSLGCAMPAAKFLIRQNIDEFIKMGLFNLSHIRWQASNEVNEL